MNDQGRSIRRVIDQNMQHPDDSGLTLLLPLDADGSELFSTMNGLTPAPPLDKLKRKPTENMIWHMKHRPYGIGGDADEQTNTK